MGTLPDLLSSILLTVLWVSLLLDFEFLMMLLILLRMSWILSEFLSLLLLTLLWMDVLPECW